MYQHVIFVNWTMRANTFVTSGHGVLRHGVWTQMAHKNISNQRTLDNLGWSSEIPFPKMGEDS